MSRRDHLNDLDDQIRDHLAREAEDNIARGMTPQEARAEAIRKFGSVARTKEDTRAVWVPVWLDQLRQDAGYAFRVFRRGPGFHAVAILTMALGIGAATMLFSVADGVLLKPLPWAEAESLVRITETRQGRAARIVGTVSNGTFLAWHDHPSATVEALGGWLTQTATLTGAGDPVRVSLIPTTPSLFPMLRARPLSGRLFHEGEGGRNQPAAVILSFGLWRERFGGQTDVLGELAHFDGKPYTIVGVMPREFAFPDREARAWTAWTVPPVQGNGFQTGVIFRAIGRLRTGATPAQAAAEATSRARSASDMGFAARALFGAEGPIDVAAVPELQAITSEVRPAILALFAGAALLLMTATANVASLQLARATTRRREMAVRAAIGAGQRRIVRQLIVENVLIGLGGGVAGLALTLGLQRWLPSLLPAGFPRLDAIAVDTRVFWFAIGVSVVASVGCGLLPAWQTRRVNLVETLSEDGVASAGASRRSPLARARGVIMVGQVAIACVLLVGAALLTRSFVSLIRADRGYDPANVLTARLPLPPGYPAERRVQLLETLSERLRAVPGITHAAYGTALPFVSFGGFTAFNMRLPHMPEVEVNVEAAQRIVSPDYFGAMRLRLVAGRTLRDTDTTATSPAVVVNRTFAQRYLGEQAIGFRVPRRGPGAGGIRFSNANPDWEVVGIVDDMRQEVDSPSPPEVFASFKQISTETTNVGYDPILVIRTESDPTTYVATLRRLVQEEAPALALDAVMTMEDRVLTSLAKPRLYAVVVVGFAAFALLIAGVGLFGVLSFSVAQRTREIGIRSALGARARDIAMLVVRQALWIVGSGLAIGFAAGLAGSRLLSASLYGVGAHDALTLVAVPTIIAMVAGFACLVPARRALRADPLAALRA